MRSTDPSLAVHRWRAGLAGLVVGAFTFGAMTLGGVVTTPATADDGSAVTVRAADYDPDAENAPFPDLEITVSQTTGLVAQGIRIDWTGGKQSTPPSGQTGGEDFLQFAQCWGDDPDKPGTPDRTTCQYGAFLTPGATRDGFRSPTEDPETGEVVTIVDPADEPYTVPANGALEPAYTSIPFRSATGVVIASVVDGTRVSGVDVNTNPFFSRFTSNEIPWAGSGADGSGSTKFEVQTVAESQGLGCGSRVTASDGSVSGSSCWLVAIPRGTADPNEASIRASGLNAETWKHHVAVRLDFRPAGLNCAIGSAERQLVGSELIGGAVASWQPALCAAPGGSAYTMITGTESDAVIAANRSAGGAAALALTSRPFALDAEDQLVYAPIGLSGVSISFAIDRFPKQDGSVPPEALERARMPFTSMNLTPRLLAKLLTSSYRDALPVLADRDHLGDNPRNLLFDPDFLAINDAEWAQQAIAGIAVSDMIVPQGRSDVADRLWNYIVADAEARAFLAGEEDPWGMSVNPYSSTDAAQNPSGVGLSLPRDSFPKADPVTVPAVEGGAAEQNLVTWRPYAKDLDDAGYLTLRGDGLVLGPWDAFASPPRYGRSVRDLPGTQSVIALTDTAAAGKYQLVSAALRNPAGAFVAPTTESLTAAAAAMTATSQPQVRQFDPTSTQAQAAPSAYPLTMPVYAAANPGLKDAELRRSYAEFIRYAATTGQTPGVQVGELPDGYAPLPTSWRDQAVTAAGWLESGAIPRGSATVTPPAAASGASATGAAVSSGAAVPAAVPAAATVAVPAADPAATGAAAGALSGATTPDDPDLVGVQAAVPASVLGGLAAAAVALWMPRLTRRV